MKHVLVTLALISPLILLSACNKDDSKALTDTVGGDSHPHLQTNCEIPGESFGIVGGRTLAIHNPLSESTVLLLHESSRTGDVAICTGTLIATDKILTAAHCVEKNGAGRTVAAFSNNAQCGISAKARTLRTITASVVHAEYLYGGDPVKNSSHDLAVLKFDGTLPSGYKVRNLPSVQDDLYDTQELIMSGYGKTQEDDDASLGVLRFTRTPKSRLSTSFYSTRSEQIIELQGVHVIDQFDTGVCQGDSGGALYAWNGHKLLFIGVTSTGVDNRNTGRFASRPRVCHGVSLFVDLRKKLDWIETAQRSL